MVPHVSMRLDRKFKSLFLQIRALGIWAKGEVNFHTETVNVFVCSFRSVEIEGKRDKTLPGTPELSVGLTETRCAPAGPGGCGSV